MKFRSLITIGLGIALLFVLPNTTSDVFERELAAPFPSVATSRALVKALPQRPSGMPDSACPYVWALAGSPDKDSPSLRTEFGNHKPAIPAAWTRTPYRKTLETTAPKRLYFHVENSMMKRLNDVLLADLGMTESVQHLYKSLFIEGLKKDPVLNHAIEAVDLENPKGLTFELHDSPDVRRRLSQLYSQVAIQFEMKLVQYPEVGLKLLQHPRAAGDDFNPRKWFTAGMSGSPFAGVATRGGRIADLAMLGARDARFLLEGPNLIDVNDGKFIQRLADEVRTTEAARAKIQNRLIERFGADTEMLTQVGPDRYVLSLKAVEILRSARSAPDLESYINYVQSRFFKAFNNAEIPREWILGMGGLQFYHHRIDLFSLSLNVQEEGLKNTENQHGLLAFDFANQGGELQFALQKAMANLGRKPLTDIDTVTRATDSARETLDREVRRFEDEKRTPLAALIKSGQFPGDPNFSRPGSQPSQIAGLRLAGDDGFHVPTVAVPYREWTRLIDGIREKNLPIRSVFIEPKFSDTKTQVSDTRNKELAVLGKDWIKSLTISLEGTPSATSQKILPARLASCKFGIYFIPDQAGGAKVKLYIAEPPGDRALTEDERSLIRRRLQKIMSESGTNFVLQ